MQTRFSAEQLRDPHLAASEKAIRTCVHCGFCNATCPTYALLGDELDGPRGRIMLMKDMLENQRTPSAETVKHIDRCLSCLSCKTTCPSGVDYMHLVDHSRAWIEQRYERPWIDRMLRGLLAGLLPYPRRFRFALAMGRLFSPLVGLLPNIGFLKSLRAMLELSRAPTGAVREGIIAAPTVRKARVAFLEGCAEPVLQPNIQQAATRLFARMGIEVVPAPGQGCCGALVHHLGKEARSLAFARANVDAWSRVIDDGGLDAIVITASGCGTSLKDYGFMLRNEPAYAARAAKVSTLARDVSEVLAAHELPAVTNPSGLIVAYHAACSLQHGQGVREAPRRLLTEAGFQLRDIAESHLCCGSAGVYNILQPDLAEALRERKQNALAAVAPQVVATGNIGCLTQLSRGKAPAPVVHTVELLDWATGGPEPEGLSRRT
ncbi:glycolate oxidase iron-sulfur subunit [Panacagrimonas perspica]|uniref:Glycolate oxidase iron-sulfur subunit n=1 Tax=Panacagrimonas perspica TaxID=381431 RepID=A0A4R7PEB8_9GAMM|nr:glycolate oxidase subunit GlcF [Panacagrimonas perspica]TDU32122.1 glycolate oxidase iron-sulfur subunit [Panacagrimonas perspica]THD01172.1 glycolate oxidase iron-sulfur subunit [Panacagrimonas perspica]